MMTLRSLPTTQMRPTPSHSRTEVRVGSGKGFQALKVLSHGDFNTGQRSLFERCKSLILLLGNKSPKMLIARVFNFSNSGRQFKK